MMIKGNKDAGIVLALQSQIVPGNIARSGIIARMYWWNTGSSQVARAGSVAIAFIERSR